MGAPKVRGIKEKKKRSLPHLAEISEQDREKFFYENCWLDLTYEVEYTCLHCGQIINSKDYKAAAESDGFVFLCCPNWPSCDGTIMDWMPIEGREYVEDGEEC